MSPWLLTLSKKKATDTTSWNNVPPKPKGEASRVMTREELGA